MTAPSVLEDCAVAGSSRLERSDLKAREYFASASTEGTRSIEKLACALVNASTEWSSASLEPRRGGISSRNMPNAHQRLYLRSAVLLMVCMKALDNWVNPLLGVGEGEAAKNWTWFIANVLRSTIPSSLFGDFENRFSSLNLYLLWPDPTQGIFRRIHREHTGCFSSHFNHIINVGLHQMQLVDQDLPFSLSCDTHRMPAPRVHRAFEMWGGRDLVLTRCQPGGGVR